MSWLRKPVQRVTAGLTGDAIKVKIGGITVEVCCDECAQKLKKAGASATAERRG
jgi:hypothetical protein